MAVVVLSVAYITTITVTRMSYHFLAKPPHYVVGMTRRRSRD